MNKSGIITELTVVFLLIMGQIWVWPDYEWLVLIPMVLATASWIYRKDTFKTLGIKPEPPSPETREFMISAFTVFFFALIAIGMIWHPDWYEKWSRWEFWGSLFQKSFYYYPWALFQQLWACGYFANRFNTLFNNPKKAALATALLFEIAHFPNPVLMTATFLGGFFSAYFFFQARNLYWIALGHAILGPAIRLFLDYSLRIGPGFWK